LKTQEYSIIGVLSSSKPNFLKYLLAKLSKNLNFSATSPKMSSVPVTVGINSSPSEKNYNFSPKFKNFAKISL
jgi:hypothetical protein